MKAHILLTGATVWMVVMGVGAQSRPDFSGTWEMDTKRTRAETRARSSQSSGGTVFGGETGGNFVGLGTPVVTAVRITQTAVTLTIERISGQVWEKVVHKLDGSESVNVNGRATLKLRSRWDGAHLVSEGTKETLLPDGFGVIGGTGSCAGRAKSGRMGTGSRSWASTQTPLAQPRDIRIDIGSNWENGATNRATRMWRMTIGLRRPTITVDDRVVMRDGEILWKDPAR